MYEKQFLMLPGPTPIPPRVLRSLGAPMINHRGPEFKKIFQAVTAGVARMFKTKNDVLTLTASGSGGMEAAVTNFINSGDRVVVVSIGSFGDRFAHLNETFGAQVDKIDFPWGTAADPAVIAAKFQADVKHEIKALFITHNETSTGVLNDLPAIRQALGDHPALIIVDSISGLGAAELATDDWDLDVVVAGSQKSFMVPPGLAFIAVSERAWEANKKCVNGRHYWDLAKAKKFYQDGETPYTPAIPQVVAMKEALEVIENEGLSNVIARHSFHRHLVRTAVRALGLELLAADAVASPVVTAVKMPAGVEGKTLLKTLREKFNVVIGGGQQHLTNKIIRIGHLGYVQDLDLVATIAALEMALQVQGYAIKLGSGVSVAQEAILNKL